MFKVTSGILGLALAIWLMGCGSGGGGGGITSEANAQTINTTTTTVISAVLFAKYEAETTSGVAVAVCPADTVAISPGCVCDITTTGDIFGLTISGNSTVCGCSVVDLDGYDVVTASVVCAKSVDSTVIDSVTLIDGVTASALATVDAEPSIATQELENRFYEMRKVMEQELIY